MGAEPAKRTDRRKKLEMNAGEIVRGGGESQKGRTHRLAAGVRSGDEMAAKAKGAFGGTAGPDWPQIDADGRKNGDMQYGQDALGEFFRLFKLESDATKPEIEDAGATAALVADNGVGVGSDHGNAFSLALNGESRLGKGRGSHLCQISCRGRGCSRNIG